MDRVSVKRAKGYVNKVVTTPAVNDVTLQARVGLTETINVENSLNSVTEGSHQGVMNPEDSPLDGYPGWWSQVDVGGARVRELLDTGCARLAMGPVALLIVSSRGKKVQPYKGPGAKVATQDVVPILGQVELPFEIAGTRRNLDVINLQNLDADCMLGADFFLAFDAHAAPRTNILVVGHPGE